jgi:site-specific recombinase XerD
MIALFYGTGLRSSEAIAATMGDISSRYEKDTDKLRTFIKVIGKGSKRRDVTVSDHVLQELRMYRTAFGLSADPLPGEATPLIFSIQIRKGLLPITRQSLYAAFKKLFDAVADEMEREGNAGHEKVRRASTHWLRRETASVRSHLDLKQPLQKMRTAARSSAH